MKKIRYPVLFLIGLLFFIGILFASIILFSYQYIRKRSLEDNSNQYIYQIAKLNPGSNSTSKKFVRLDKVLQPDEFIHYKNLEGEFFTVSQFTDQDYECTGYCYCKDEDENMKSRRRFVSSISSGLVIIVSAISTLMAISVTTEYFKQQCVKELGHTCAISSIATVLKKCSTMKIQSNIQKPKKVVLNCFGFCCTHRELKHLRLIHSSLEFGCRNYQLRADIEIYQDETKGLSEHRELIELAKEKFCRTRLNPFCKIISVSNEVIVWSNPKQVDDVRRFERKVSLCVGYQVNLPVFTKNYDNIGCMTIEDLELYEEEKRKTGNLKGG